MFKIRDFFSSALTLVALTPTCVVMAVGVGDIRVQSHLNEPLHAEIPLIDTKGLEPSDLQVKIALSEEFEKNNIEALPWLQQIRFEIIKKPDGKSVVQMTTTQPVKDPIVDLIVQLNWTDGQIIRDFTVLLDPPSKSSAVKTINNKKLVVAKSEGNPVTMGDQYRSLENQTLWRIAKQLVSGSDFTVYQGVVAIMQKNPELFKQGFHNIPKGASLMMPSQAELNQIDKQQAKTLFHQFNKGEISQLPTLIQTSETKPQTEILSEANDVSIAVPKPKSTKHLKIVSDTEVTDTTKPMSQNTGMDDRLNQVEEAIDSLKRQNEEISQKNKQLQSQNESLLQTLATKEEELNRLRARTEEQAERVNFGIPDKPQPPRSIEAVQLSTHDTQTTVMDLTKQDTIPADPKPASPKLPNAPQAVDFDDVGDSGTDVYYALFLMIFSLCIAAWAWFSRNTILRFLQPFLSSFSRRTIPLTGKGISNDKANYGINFDFNASLEELLKKENVMRSIAMNQKKQENLLKKEPSISVQDADVYIAYEHYDQAIKLLESIVHTQPSNWEALIKLLEVFIQTKQYDEFHKWQAKVPPMLQEMEPQLWAKYNELKKSVYDEHPMDVEVELQACPLPEVMENNPLENLEVENKEEVVEAAPIVFKKPMSAEKPKPAVNKEISEKIEKKSEKPAENDFNKSSESSSWGKLELVKEEDYQAEFNQAKAYIDAGDIEPGKAILEKLLVKAPHLKTDVEATLNKLNG